MYKNAAEYHHPALYDDEFGNDDIKYDFFYRFAQSKKRILDLACGTGLVSLYMANQGVRDITAVDILPHMIEHAKQKDSQNRIHFLVSDATQYASPVPFDFIFLTGNAFQAFHSEEDQVKLLANVAKLCENQGTFIFEMRNPDHFDLSDRPIEFWHTFTASNGEVNEVKGSQKYDPSSEILTWTTYRTSATQTLHADIECKFTQPTRVETLLLEAGFDVVQRFEDWNQSAFNPDTSENIIFVCTKRK